MLNSIPVALAIRPLRRTLAYSRVRVFLMNPLRVTMSM